MDSLSGFDFDTTSNTSSNPTYVEATWEAVGGPEAMEYYDNCWLGEDDWDMKERLRNYFDSTKSITNDWQMIYSR